MRRLHRLPRPWSSPRRCTADEVAEALGVAVLMNGGPGTVHAARAFAACREFAGDDR